MDRRLWAVIVLLAASFAVSALLYEGMPYRMASHWNMAGEADGWMFKQFALFLLPALTLVLTGLLLVLPRLDPLQANIKKFEQHYHRFVLAFVAFMIYIHALTLVWNSGVGFSMSTLMALGFAALFYSIGSLLQHTEPNWFIGIRTPWTLSDPVVWRRTHAVGGTLFKAAGCIALLGFFIESIAFWLMIIPAIAAGILTTVYSYVQFRKTRGRIR